MVNKRTINFLLIAILTVGFIYRFGLLTWNVFPPGGDVGLHESVINSILAPKTTFLYNYYHMGGGVSVTNPGYHIFAAFAISITGAPDYLVQAAVTALFSALIIAGTFLLTRLIFGIRAGLVAAILTTFSAADILMLTWAGYPNIVALMLIPTLFYLFLQPQKLTSRSYLATTTVLVSALFLTHVFSGLVFLATTIFTMILSVVLRRSTGFSPKKAIYWLIPIFFGVILASPYLLSVFPLYFGSEGAIMGSVSSMKVAVVETRLVPTSVLVLAIIPIVLFLVFSKNQKSRFFTLPSVLFASSILISIVASQAYLLGFFLDYERFLYFLSVPVIICIALILVYSSNFITRVMQKVKPKIPTHTKTAVLSFLVIVCLGTSVVGPSLFTLPDKAETQATYFQVMNPPRYEALQWIKTNTPPDAVCVADSGFGWWLSGFAKRPTLSAVDPQFLILQREFGPAQVASDLLRADYLVENGLLQIEQLGAYANGSGHDIYAVLSNSIIKPLVFSLNDTQMSLLYRDGGTAKEAALGAFNNSYTQVANDGNSTSFIISRENPQFRITEEITLRRGMRFAEVTFVFQNKAAVNFDWLRLPFQSAGALVQYANSVGIVDGNNHWINQIVLPNNQLGGDITFQENAEFYELICNLEGNSNAVLQFYVGLVPFEPNSDIDQSNYHKSLIENNTRTYLEKVSDYPINCFDYKAAINQYNISYVAVRDSSSLPRFQDDPTYSLAFKNKEVSIYKVNRT